MKKKLLASAMSLMTTGIVLAATAQPVFAKDNPTPPGQEDCKPGNGWGDKNHEHCGPPGQSTHPGDSTHPEEELTFAWVHIVTDDLVALFRNNHFFQWLSQVTPEV